MPKTNLIIVGANGRMGKALLVAASEEGSAQAFVVNAVSRQPELGLSSTLPIFSDLAAVLKKLAAQNNAAPTIMVDFTNADISVEHARLCASMVGKMEIGAVIGTTGFNADQDAELEELSSGLPMVKSGNMSLGITLLKALVADVAEKLSPNGNMLAGYGDQFDIEIVESHHRHKVDAPSGTAFLLGEAAAKAQGKDLKTSISAPREGMVGARKEGEIGFAVVRGGSIIGQHDVHFISASETITLGHKALDRQVFARGGLAAAQWLSQNGTQLRTPGLYSMADVMDL